MAKTLKLNKLKDKFQFVCNEYAMKFANKQKLEFHGWVGDEVGGVACYNFEYYFSFENIVHDINTCQEKGFIMQWHDEMIEYSANEKNEVSKFVNYKSYCMGARFSDFEHESFIKNY